MCFSLTSCGHLHLVWDGGCGGGGDRATGVGVLEGDDGSSDHHLTARHRRCRLTATGHFLAAQVENLIEDWLLVTLNVLLIHPCDDVTFAVVCHFLGAGFGGSPSKWVKVS